jgi:hypothetical protein
MRFEILILNTYISPVDSFVLVERNYSTLLEETHFTITLKRLHTETTFSAASLTLVILFAFIALISLASVTVFIVMFVRQKRKRQTSTINDTVLNQYQQLKD